MPVMFVDLAQQCAPQIAAETLGAIVSVESGFQPFAIRINSDHPLPDQPRSRSEAIETATILVAEGHDVDLGLGGVNSGDLVKLGLSVADGFDFCINLKASASLLDDYYQVAVRAGATPAEAHTLMLRAWYGRGDAALGEMVGYDRKVLAERDRLARSLSDIEIADTEATALAQGGAGEAKTVSAGKTLPTRMQESSAAFNRTWDVFNSGERSTVLVFTNEPKER